jgi:superfamily II DNA or RNA helicase
MSFAILRSSISQSQYDNLVSGLCFQPEGYNDYNPDNIIGPILFFIERDGMIYIPYLYGSAFFKFIPNINNPFPQTNIIFTGTLRKIQIPVEQEAWNQLQTRGTTTLGLYPGFGKTILGAKLSSRTGLLTVILVHRELLTVQWKKTFTDFTNASVWIVGESHPPQYCDIIICMDTRWEQIPMEYRLRVGFLIIDEAHAFCTPSHINCLLAFPKVIYTAALTAYLLRDDGMHIMIYAMCGEHGVFRENDLPFNVMKINTNMVPNRKLNRRKKVDWPALEASVANDERRNQIILGFVLNNLNRKILILTSLVEHTNLLYSLIRNAGIKCDYFSGNKKDYVDSTVLVGTKSKIGTGFDPASFCETYDGNPFDLLILACSIKKYSMLVQNVGRCLRANCPTVVHLVDKDTIYTAHWYKARKWYLIHGGTITEHSIPNENLQQRKTINQIQQNWIQEKTLTLNVIQK